MKSVIFFISCLFYVSFIHAQEHEHEHEHEHLRNEIGLGSGALYSLGHETWGVGTHLHYFRTLGMHSKWSLGGGVEQVWGIGSHFNVGAGVKYQLFNRMCLSLAPGITFFSHNEIEAHRRHKSQKTWFTTHFELIYDLFHWEHFHVGTVFDYSLTKDDSHVALGIHTAFCF